MLFQLTVAAVLILQHTGTEKHTEQRVCGGLCKKPEVWSELKLHDFEYSKKKCKLIHFYSTEWSDFAAVWSENIGRKTQTFLQLFWSDLELKYFFIKMLVKYTCKSNLLHEDPLNYKDSSFQGCWLHRRFDKAVIILIDALRFDFVAPTSDTQDKPYINKMRTVHGLLQNKPKNTRLYKFTADPPTTTLQRLKGLTTGSLPTFVDAGSNFASAEITEDNFIDQLVKKGKKLTFLGDDTWTNLFPGRFNRQYPFPSFNVKDLHTVDDGILENIYQEMRLKDSDITIGHFLGVDHCGHRYGPNHPAMTEKLIQMDDMIRNVTQRLGKDTILFVLGDHGMTHTGDHGGDSDEELDAALFVYSPSQITASKYEPGKFKTVSQIDLVPTISLLLGAPVPFSSLGTVITDLMNHCSWSKDSHIKEVFHTVEALRVNAVQISQYVTEYMKTSSDLPTHKLLLLNERLRNAELQLQTLVTNMFINNNADNAHERLHHLENEYKAYMQQVRQLCKEVWAKFDMTSMVLGILILTVTLLVNIYLLFASQSLSADKDNGTMIIVLVLSFVFVIFSMFQSFYLNDRAVSIMAFLLGIFDFVALGIIILIARNSLTMARKNHLKHLLLHHCCKELAEV